MWNFTESSLDFYLQSSTHTQLYQYRNTIKLVQVANVWNSIQANFIASLQTTEFCQKFFVCMLVFSSARAFWKYFQNTIAQAIETENAWHGMKRKQIGVCFVFLSVLFVFEAEAYHICSH